MTLALTPTLALALTLALTLTRYAGLRLGARTSLRGAIAEATQGVTYYESVKQLLQQATLPSYHPLRQRATLPSYQPPPAGHGRLALTTLPLTLALTVVLTRRRTTGPPCSHVSRSCAIRCSSRRAPPLPLTLAPQP